MTDAQPPADPHRTLRRIVLGIFLVSMLGSAIELLLMQHFGDGWQLLPLVLFGLSMIALVGQLIFRRAALVRTFQVTMVLFLIGGVIGLVLHYQAKAEFARERDPSLAGMQLFTEAMKGAMPPALAPGIMIQLGVLGLAWTWRHPATRSPTHGRET